MRRNFLFYVRLRQRWMDKQEFVFNEGCKLQFSRNDCVICSKQFDKTVTQTGFLLKVFNDFLKLPTDASRY